MKNMITKIRMPSTDSSKKKEKIGYIKSEVVNKAV